MPPAGTRSRAGLRSVVEGFRFLGTRPNLRMTFVIDLVAMILAQPRALLPAIGALMIGGGEATVGDPAGVHRRRRLPGRPLLRAAGRGAARRAPPWSGP